jgi:hypothetical protein
VGGIADVTRAPVESDYPTLLGSPAPRLWAYPVETVVAEKFEALTTLGIANTRLKDFYDPWLIAQTYEFRQHGLIEAVRHTFGRRGTARHSKLRSDCPTNLRRRGLRNGVLFSVASKWPPRLMSSPRSLRISAAF